MKRIKKDVVANYKDTGRADKAQLRVYSKECIEQLNGLDPTKIEFIKVTANEIEIREPVITNTCRSIERYTLLRNEKIIETYKEVLKRLEREHCKRNKRIRRVYW